MLGFKFQYYSRRDASAPPDALYHMCGLLLQQGSVDSDGFQREVAVVPQKRRGRPQQGLSVNGEASLRRREARSSP